MKVFIFLSFIFSSLLFSECNFSLKNETVEWQAYKTLAKLGVNGKFDVIDMYSHNDKSIESLLSSTSLKIDTLSVNSNNKDRDKTLIKSFFKVQNVDTIDAKVLSVDKDNVEVEITLNKVTKTIPMKLVNNSKNIELKGVIDLADFDMLKSLSSINKACYDLHKGKTWQDVAISFKADIAKDCE